MTSNQDILNCELEPIRFPGAVQSHGALVVLGKDGVTIEAASESCTRLLGCSPASLIGQTVDRLFGSEHASRLVSCQGSALTPLVPLTTEQGRYWARSSCNAEGQVLIDIEPASQRASANELLYQFRHLFIIIQYPGGCFFRKPYHHQLGNAFILR